MFRKFILVLLVVVAAALVAAVAVHAATPGGIYTFSHLKSGTAAASATVETRSNAGGSGGFYTVIKGDTPVAIAKKLHVGCDDLLALNRITDPGKLQIGQKLQIPKATEP